MANYEVNIDLANQTKREMADAINTGNENVLNRMGAFSALYDARFASYRHPVLVLKTEEPGSKQLIASQYDKIENVSYDMINHLINDCIVMGAKPLTVQDAIICGRLDGGIVKRIVKAISDACKAQDCVLTGGETSEQPGVISDGTYILTSSIVGIVDKDEIIDGSQIKEGDAVLSLESSGIHTNGLTLVRTIMREHPEILNETLEGRPFIDGVLEPHRCYYLALRDLFGTGKISGLAHITGGGIRENLNRILPERLDAEIDLASYDVLPIFKLLRQYGNVSDEEMLRTFNLGVGIALVADPAYEAEIAAHLEKSGVRCTRIGRIVPGSGAVRTTGALNWA